MRLVGAESGMPRCEFDRWEYNRSPLMPVSRELADEARKCLPHITDPSVRMILEKVANCYPEEECK